MKNKVLWLSVTSGVLLSLPWVVRGTGWILLFAFIPLLLAGRTKSGAIFLQSYPAFLIWNLLSTWWIGYVSIFGMLFIAVANSFFMSVVWWAACKMVDRFGKVPGYFSLLVFWISYEFISHKGALPWPWLTLGNGFASSVKLIQWFEFTGVLGGSMWILLVNVAVFECMLLVRKSTKEHAWKFPLGAIVMIVLPILLSYYLYESETLTGKRINAVILQPNIDPYTEKFSGMTEKEQVDRLINLAKRSVSDSTHLIVAPETAFPAFLEDSIESNVETIRYFREGLKLNSEKNLIGGAITKVSSIQRGDFEKKPKASGGGTKSFNSAFLVTDWNKIQYAHKNLLVAGVEKTPFREYLDFLPDLLIETGGSTGELTPGNEPKLFKMNSGELAGPIICFESIFGDYVRKQVLNGANFLVVLTNDGWWKRSPGTWQHFDYARLRAIEHRRMVCQSANTGVSGCIDQSGEVLLQSGVNTSCSLKCSLICDSRITFYTIYGDYLGWSALVLSFGIILYNFVRVGQKKSALIRL
jgi:apolipoprotein N-acyltransferase